MRRQTSSEAGAEQAEAIKELQAALNHSLPEVIKIDVTKTGTHYRLRTFPHRIAGAIKPKLVVKAPEPVVQEETPSKANTILLALASFAAGAAFGFFF